MAKTNQRTVFQGLRTNQRGVLPVAMATEVLPALPSSSLGTHVRQSLLTFYFYC